MLCQWLYLVYHHCSWPTVRGDITSIRSDPDSPIAGTGTGCLSAGTTAKIICDNVGFPVPTVEFLKDGTVITADAR